MAITTRVIADELDSLLSYLLDNSIAIFTNPVSRVGERVSWHSPTIPDGPFIPGEKHSVAGYREWLSVGAYSAILYDGALLQVSYDIAAGAVIGHRLAYVPCPFNVDPGLLVENPVGEVIDVYSGGGAAEVILAGMVRFDYDETAARPGHPASHMTVISQCCRVPCAAPVRIGRFVDFIFRNFYPGVWEKHNYLRSLSLKDLADRTVTEEETRQMHISWAR